MTLFWVPILLCMSSLWITPTMAKIDLKDWQCGSEEMSKKMAYDTVMESCPESAPHMNHCCVVHDDCYVRQLGQEKCDQEFCDCNMRALNNTHGIPCRGQASFVCAIMPWVGIIAYDNSVNYTEPHDMPKYIPQKLVVEDQYTELYAVCATVNSTISSCALNLNECMQSSKTYLQCSSDMCDCLNDAASVDNDMHCQREITHTCTLALEVAAREDSRTLLEMPYSTFCIVLVVLCLIVAATARLTGLCTPRGTKEMKLLKYTAV